MKKVVRILLSAGITETGTIARMVGFDDGSTELQSYNVNRGWISGGIDFMSMMYRENPDAVKLKKLGLSDEKIREVISDKS